MWRCTLGGRSPAGVARPSRVAGVAWARVERRQAEKPFARSAPIPNRIEAHDRSDGDEDEGEEPQAEGDVRRKERGRSGGECDREVDEDFVQHEQDHAEPDEADPAPGAAVLMDDRRCGHRGPASDCGSRGCDDGGPFGFWEIRGGISATRVAPPSLILRNPAEGGAATRARKLRSRLRRISSAGVAIPTVVLRDVRQFAATGGTRMLDLGRRSRWSWFGDRL